MTARVRALPRLLRLCWSVDPRRVAGLLALAVFLGLLPLGQVHALRRLAEVVQQIGLDPAGAVPPSSASLASALGWGLALGALALADGAIRHVVLALRTTFGELLRVAMHERAYRRMHTLPLAAFELPARHDQLQRVRQGLDQRLVRLVLTLVGALANIVTVTSLLAYLAQFSWALSAALCAGTLPGLFFHHRYLVWRYLADRQQTPEQRRFGVISGLLTSRAAAAEIRLFGLGSWFVAEAARLWEPLARHQLAFAVRFSSSRMASDGVNVFAHVLTLAVAIGLVAGGRTGLGVAAALFAAIERFQSGIRFLLDEVVSVYADLRYLEEYFEIVDTPPDAPSAVSVGMPVDAHRLATLPSPPTPPRSGIVLEGVSFTYPGSAAPTLQDIGLVVRPGERLAIVGENGAGKSTLAKLVMGLYEPTAGRITVDGMDLRHIDASAWHRRVGAVFQDFLRYQTSVRENIGVGWVEQLDDGALIARAAAQSSAAGVAATLPRGLDTPLGKEFHDGVELSVGQWQKIAIARAYLRPAELLVLDEPASALDAKAEAAVYERFAELSEGRTMLLISHRLGSSRLASRIVVLKSGRIVEQGTHAELLEAAGEYASLYHAQAAWYR